MNPIRRAIRLYASAAFSIAFVTLAACATNPRPAGRSIMPPPAKPAVARDYSRWLDSLYWAPYERWATNYDEPAPVFRGKSVEISGAPGSRWVSGRIPMPLDDRNLRVTVAADLSGGRFGIIWCNAHHGKIYPIVWGYEESPGKWRVPDAPARPTTAYFRLVVELGPAGRSELAIAECRGESDPELRVLVNQVGYDVGRPKSFVVQANWLPRELQNAAAFADSTPRFTVLALRTGPDTRYVPKYVGRLAPAGPVDEWGRTFWRGEFGTLDEPRNYYIRVTLGDPEAGGLDAESPLFTIDTNLVARKTLDLAQRFYWYQRCGMAISGWHGVCHLDDRIVMPDGTSREATGGWHDAGDYGKYIGDQPLAFFGITWAHEFHPEMFPATRTPGVSDALDEARWGADYFRKLIDPGTGRMWNSIGNGLAYWGRAEDDTDGVPGNADDRIAVGEAASWYATSALAWVGFQTGDRRYTDAALLHGKRLGIGPSASGDVWFCARRLALATGDRSYAAIADSCGRMLARTDGVNGNQAAYLAAWLRENRGKFAADDPIVAQAETSLVRWGRTLVAKARNPFGISQAGSDRYFSRPAKHTDWFIGLNIQYLSEAWQAFSVYAATGDTTALRFGLDQVNWVLGVNPYGLCMLEGAGRVHTATVHHRYFGTLGLPDGRVPGAVYNGISAFGPESDIPLWDNLEQGTPRWQSNEPWIPHNAYFLLALTELATIDRRR